MSEMIINGAMMVMSAAWLLEAGEGVAVSALASTKARLGTLVTIHGDMDVEKLEE